MRARTLHSLRAFRCSLFSLECGLSWPIRSRWLLENLAEPCCFGPLGSPTLKGEPVQETTRPAPGRLSPVEITGHSRLLRRGFSLAASAVRSGTGPPLLVSPGPVARATSWAARSTGCARRFPRDKQGASPGASGSMLKAPASYGQLDLDHGQPCSLWRIHHQQDLSGACMNLSKQAEA
jgi:hypothetical protein